MLGPKGGGIVFVIPAGEGASGVGTNAGSMGGNYTFPKSSETIDCTDSIGWNTNPTTVGKKIFDFDLWNLAGFLKRPCRLFECECLYSTGTPDTMQYDLDGYMYDKCFIFSDHDQTPS